MSYLIGPQNLTNETTSCFDDVCCEPWSSRRQSTITYPYNPDGNADAIIGVTDLQDMLSTYGGAFSPSEIQIDGVGLAEVVGQLQATVEAQQAYITQLQQYVSIFEETVLISGANLQVVSGEGITDGPTNGTGNIIIGYDEEELFGNADKSGSHNLVVGYGHTYSSFGGIVVGYNNSITGHFSSVSGGSLTRLLVLLLRSRGGMTTPPLVKCLPSRGDSTTWLRAMFLPPQGDMATPLREPILRSRVVLATMLRESILPSWGDMVTASREPILPRQANTTSTIDEPLLDPSFRYFLLDCCWAI